MRPRKKRFYEANESSKKRGYEKLLLFEIKKDVINRFLNSDIIKIVHKSSETGPVHAFEFFIG